MERQFEPGQTVQTIFGKIAIVRMQIGCRVWLEGYGDSWFHPTKIFTI